MSLHGPHLHIICNIRLTCYLNNIRCNLKTLYIIFFNNLLFKKNYHLIIIFLKMYYKSQKYKTLIRVVTRVPWKEQTSNGHEKVCKNKDEKLARALHRIFDVLELQYEIYLWHMHDKPIRWLPREHVRGCLYKLFFGLLLFEILRSDKNKEMHIIHWQNFWNVRIRGPNDIKHK